MSLQWDHVNIDEYEQIMTKEMMRKKMYKRTAEIAVNAADSDRTRKKFICLNDLTQIIL